MQPETPGVGLSSGLCLHLLPRPSPSPASPFAAPTSTVVLEPSLGIPTPGPSHCRSHFYSHGKHKLLHLCSGGGHVCATARVEVRGQHAEVSALFPLCGFCHQTQVASLAGAVITC